MSGWLHPAKVEHTWSGRCGSHLWVLTGWAAHPPEVSAQSDAAIFSERTPAKLFFLGKDPQNRSFQFMYTKRFWSKRTPDELFFLHPPSSRAVQPPFSQSSRHAGFTTSQAVALSAGSVSAVRACRQSSRSKASHNARRAQPFDLRHILVTDLRQRWRRTTIPLRGTLRGATSTLGLFFDLTRIGFLESDF